jgi:hypothetical protein
MGLCIASVVLEAVDSLEGLSLPFLLYRVPRVPYLDSSSHPDLLTWCQLRSLSINLIFKKCQILSHVSNGDLKKDKKGLKMWLKW